MKFCSVKKTRDLVQTILKWAKTEPDGDGTAAYYNVTGVFDTNKSENHLVVCIQEIACQYLIIQHQNY